MQEEKVKINEESVWRQFLKLSIPIAAANFLQSAYSMTDAFWLGRFNSGSLAAVSVCYSIVFLVISLGAGLFVSSTVMISHHKGREDGEKINHVSAQLILLMIFVSFILSVLGYLASPFLIKLIGAESLVPFGALSYLQLFFMSTFFVFSFAVYQSLMRALGKVWLPLLITLSTVILNFLIDPFFIFGLGLGTVGAAWATIFCEVINTLVALWLLLSCRSEIILERKNFVPNWKELKKILKIGIPGSMEQFFRSAGLVIITFLVTGFGVSSMAAYGVGGEILGLVMVISLSFMMSTSIMVGRSVGAGRLERAEAVTRAVAKISFFVLTILGIFLFFFAEDISRMFIPNDLEVIRQSAEYIRIISLFFGFFGLQQIFNGTFTGAGDTVTSMFLSVFAFWIFRIPLAYILSHYTPLGFFGVCWSFSITCIIGAFLGYLVFRSGRWKERMIRH